MTVARTQAYLLEAQVRFDAAVCKLLAKLLILLFWSGFPYLMLSPPRVSRPPSSGVWVGIQVGRLTEAWEFRDSRLHLHVVHSSLVMRVKHSTDRRECLICGCTGATTTQPPIPTQDAAGLELHCNSPANVRPFCCPMVFRSNRTQLAAPALFPSTLLSICLALAPTLRHNRPAAAGPHPT